MALPVKQSYINAFIMYMSIFAAGAVLLEIAPTFILVMEEFKVNAMMVGFLVAAFVVAFVVFGGLIMFRAYMLVTADLRWTVTMGTGIVGIFGFLTGFAPNYWSMWIFRFAVGFAGNMLMVTAIFLAINWFPVDKLNTVVSSGIVSLVLGTLVASFFGSKIASVVGGWRSMYSIFGGIGLLAFILWLIFGKSMPSATDGAGLASSERSPAARAFTNGYVWCSAGMLYMLYSFLGVFTFIFIAVAGSFDLAVMSKAIVFPLPYYLSAICNMVVMISGSVVGLWLLTKTGRRKPFSVIPGLFAPVVGLAIFSLPFAALPIILELILVAMFLLMIVISTWVVQVQELPGVSFDILVNTIGAVLLISGIAGAIVPIATGWALDQGWVVFKNTLYFFILTWLVCGLAGLLIPEPGSSR